MTREECLKRVSDILRSSGVDDAELLIDALEINTHQYFRPREIDVSDSEAIVESLKRYGRVNVILALKRNDPRKALRDFIEFINPIWKELVLNGDAR